MLIYEDTAGQEYTEETAFTTTINKPVIPTSTDNETEEPEKAGQWWISIVIGSVIAAGLAAYIIIRKKRKVKSNKDL